MPRLTRFLIPAVAALALVACGGGDSDAVDSTSAPESSALTVVNETPCVIHVRFDNGVGVMRVLPGESGDFDDGKLDDYRWLQIESTHSIFRNYPMDEIRADGYRLTVRPSLGDNDCVEEP